MHKKLTDSLSVEVAKTELSVRVAERGMVLECLRETPTQGWLKGINVETAERGCLSGLLERALLWFCLIKNLPCGM